MKKYYGKNEEKVRDNEYINQISEHIIHYTNIQDIEDQFLKDNDIINFSTIDLFHEMQDIGIR